MASWGEEDSRCVGIISRCVVAVCGPEMRLPVQLVPALPEVLDAAQQAVLAAALVEQDGELDLLALDRHPGCVYELVEYSKVQVGQLSQSGIVEPCLDRAPDHIFRQLDVQFRLLVVARHGSDHVRVPKEVLEELGGDLGEVSSHLGAVEAAVRAVSDNVVDGVAQLMEQIHDVGVFHQVGRDCVGGG